MELEFYGEIFEKYSDIKFHGLPPSENRVFPCGRTDRRTDITKLIVVFRNFANALKKKEKVEWTTDLPTAVKRYPANRCFVFLGRSSSVNTV